MQNGKKLKGWAKETSDHLAKMCKHTDISYKEMLKKNFLEGAEKRIGLT